MTVPTPDVDPGDACTHESLYGGADTGVWTCDGCADTVSAKVDSLAGLCARAGTPCASGLTAIIDTLQRELDAYRRPPGLPGPDVDLPDEAIEAAARRSYEFAWRLRPVIVHWEDADEYIHDEYRADARAVLAAAMPAIRRQIADEIANDLQLTRAAYDPERPIAPYVRDAYARGMHRAEAVARGGSDADL